MPCYSPLKGYYSKEVNPTGKRSIVFNIRQAQDDKAVELPCGQCIGCRLERARQWAVRIMHEASLYSDNMFLTLTYSPEKVPPDGNLRKSDFQKFMKRLRKAYPHKKIRFFHCGEYGDQYQRPHYHAIIFNLDMDDKKYYQKTKDNHRVYISEQLDSLWSHGHCFIGDVTFESAGYVARYVTKKVTGKNALHHYNLIDNSGEIVAEIVPEYCTMSRRPGIGKPWLDKFHSDVFPHGFVIVNGRRCTPPRFYDAFHQKLNSFDYDDLKERRYTESLKHKHDNTTARLRVKETCRLERVKNLKRKI